MDFQARRRRAAAFVVALAAWVFVWFRNQAMGGSRSASPVEENHKGETSDAGHVDDLIDIVAASISNQSGLMENDTIDISKVHDPPSSREAGFTRSACADPQIQVHNTVTWNLNGSAWDVLESYDSAISHARLWNQHEARRYILGEPWKMLGFSERH
ncbi:hypothetical protein ACP4OV_020401 [Aristida adscensionis]